MKVTKTTKKSTEKTVKKATKTRVAKATKPTAKKKTADVKRPTMKSYLTRAEIKKFKTLLIIKTAEICGDITQMEADSLRDSRGDAAGDLSSMPIHMADIGTDNFEQEFTIGLMDSERKLLKEISDALSRIKSNEYGICQGTDKPINKLRLEAKPWARYCIEYAKMVEKGLVVEGEKYYDQERKQGYDYSGMTSQDEPEQFIDFSDDNL